MRLRWFIASVLVFLVLYICLAKYIKPTVTSLLSLPLQVCQDISSQAKQFLTFNDLVEENKRLKEEAHKMSAQLIQLQELQQENARLHGLLSLPQRQAWQTIACLVIGKDSSNWTRTILINKGTTSGIKKGMPAVYGAGLAGKVIEAHPFTSKIVLLVDFNSKVPAKILRSREEGIVFGSLARGQNICKMKYLQGEVKLGDKVISSGLGRLFPKGLLIGEIIAVEEKNQLYKVAEIRTTVDFSTLEEVMVIIN